MMEQAPPRQLMKREMHGGAIPLGPKQTSKIKGIPFLKCLLLLRERFFSAFRATKPASWWCMREESSSFSSLWHLEVISPEDARRAHYIQQNQKRTATCLIFICGGLATMLQSDQRPQLPSLQSWISYRAGSLPQVQLVLTHRVPWGEAPTCTGCCTGPQ